VSTCDVCQRRVADLPLLRDAIEERDAARARCAMLTEALNEASDAIDAVESEPGAGTIFAMDWTRALKLLRDSDDTGVARWLEAHDAKIAAAARAEALEFAAKRADLRAKAVQLLDGFHADRIVSPTEALKTSFTKFAEDLRALKEPKP